MKKSLVMILAAGVLCAPALAQQPASDKKPASTPPAAPATKAPPAKPEAKPDAKQPADAAMMPPGPGAEHKKLDGRAGKWDCACKFWMAPGQPPMEAKASEECRWTLDGRFMECDFTTDLGGMPFRGRQYLGYNLATKKYESLWIDSMDTGMTLMTGNFDADGKTLTLTGTSTDMATGKLKTYKSVVKHVDANKAVFEMFEVVDGKDNKNMEITYTRAGAAATLDKVKEDTNRAIKDAADKVKKDLEKPK